MKLILVLSFLYLPVFAQQPDWSEGVEIPIEGRANPYNLNAADFLRNKQKGQIHTQVYPVEVTAMLPPYEPMKRFIEEKTLNPLKILVKEFFQSVTHFKKFNDFLKWMGLHEYPLEKDQGVYSVTYPQGQRPDHPMGFGLIKRNGATGFTVSCAGCHSSRLFGKTVLGLTNRFPLANEVFNRAKKVSSYVSPAFFQFYTGATDQETDLLRQYIERLKSVGVRQPLTLGLDTSLAQVALSLNLRNLDPYATFSKHYQKSPRADLLDHQAADSKPAVWWNLKYKNRWLSDGSVVSGNPIYTNILWNEIGRGADLHELEDWFFKNQNKIQELTTAVFSSEAPRITDFFSEEQIDIAKAQRGEAVFNARCNRCHGTYQKNWQAEGSISEKIKTIQVVYPEFTMVKDVGTDPLRYQGMVSLTPLNDLEISKKIGVLIKPQKGYVPPPLVGIWARWPYLHNNSIPNLCALLTRADLRPKFYYSGAAQNPQRDFDFECNGYPLGEKVPKAWQRKEYLYKSDRPGLMNTGHDVKIFLDENGQELLSKQEKLDLIHYLQTL